MAGDRRGKLFDCCGFSTDGAIARRPVAHCADPRSAHGYLARPDRPAPMQRRARHRHVETNAGAARSSGLHRRRSHLYDPFK